MDRRKARKLLDEERTRLQGVLEALADEGVGEQSDKDAFSELSLVDQHPADMGTETFERQKDMSILQQVQAELADVERALERIEAGTYGTCEACGKAIGDDRLAARPAARFCIEDQARLERETRSA